MKRILIIAACLINLHSLHAIQTLNAVIGDEGWKSFVTAKQELTEKEKIAAHLQFVEEKLRNFMPEELSPEQKMNRLRLLDHLHAYWSSGNFPMNENSPFEREPTFIDCRGNICAVGYLIEQSAGMEMAEHVNGKFHNKYISEMQDAALEMWMEENGVSATDCAMIQPTYGGSSGPSLKDYPDDSLLSLISRNVIYVGKPDSCTIAFQVDQNGKMYNSSVASGNEVLGNSVLYYMKKLEYVPYREWGKYSHRINGQSYEPVVQLKICYGVNPPVTPNRSTFVIVKDSLTPTKASNYVKINGRVTEKASEGSLTGFVVTAYSDSGKTIASCQTDIDGNYRLVIPKYNLKKIRIEIRHSGYENVIIPNVEIVNQNISVQMEFDLQSFRINENPCSGLPCMGAIYLRPMQKN